MIRIIFDGGCRPTNPGNKYGSFEVLIDGLSVGKQSRFELGHGTNNEAEYEALEMGLKWTVDLLNKSQISPKTHELVMQTDSRIVISRISGRNRSVKTEAQQRMAQYARQCLDLISNFGGFKIMWAGRETNVARFGH